MYVAWEGAAKKPEREVKIQLEGAKEMSPYVRLDLEKLLKGKLAREHDVGM